MHPNITESLYKLTVPDLKQLLLHLPNSSTAGNKANLVAAIELSLLDEGLHAIWESLADVNRAAVAEAVHHPHGE